MFKPIRSQHLRHSANGEQCTLNIAGVCNYDPSTVVLAHLPDESKGMGTKADDISACYACCDCHAYLDGENLLPEDKDFYLRRALVRTWRRWIERDLVVIKGVNA